MSSDDFEVGSESVEPDSAGPKVGAKDLGGKETSGFQFSAWNLVLLLPLVILITPLFNFGHPALFGMPFFYWFQLAFVVVGVICVVIVYAMTRHIGVNVAPDRLSVDELDEGAEQ